MYTGLPTELIQKTASDIPLEDIPNLCRTNTQLYNAVCNDPQFWRRRISEDYNTSFNSENDNASLVALGIDPSLPPLQKYTAFIKKWNDAITQNILSIEPWITVPPETEGYWTSMSQIVNNLKSYSLRTVIRVISHSKRIIQRLLVTLIINSNTLPAESRTLLLNNILNLNVDFDIPNFRVLKDFVYDPVLLINFIKALVNILSLSTQTLTESASRRSIDLLGTQIPTGFASSQSSNLLGYEYVQRILDKIKLVTDEDKITYNNCLIMGTKDDNPDPNLYPAFDKDVAFDRLLVLNSTYGLGSKINTIFNLIFGPGDGISRDTRALWLSKTLAVVPETFDFITANPRRLTAYIEAGN